MGRLIRVSPSSLSFRPVKDVNKSPAARIKVHNHTRQATAHQLLSLSLFVASSTWGQQQPAWIHLFIFEWGLDFYTVTTSTSPTCE